MRTIRFEVNNNKLKKFDIKMSGENKGDAQKKEVTAFDQLLIAVSKSPFLKAPFIKLHDKVE